MAWQTTGLMPSEFDDTTNLILRTVQAAGTSDLEIRLDRDFLIDLIKQVAVRKPDSLRSAIEMMDLAFIGLLIHRHLPYQLEDGQMETPHTADAEYFDTMNNMIGTLIERHGVDRREVEHALGEAVERSVSNFEVPESMLGDAAELHTQVVTLVAIGVLSHRLMPTTNEPPIPQ